ncbi:Response regulator [Serratia rubidaea]|uniref:helix-turn-helix transcriptional regulator n=1 Tax=Serratia rubidaea TaxID=61652 RepID=UPI0006C7683B|nr:LuxR C-terminal-related transcriptional regulator [Serratia rubidaea]QPR64277.1 helix-turn-helix transcriptional regulator [Serratia rubidaea]CAI1067962.1 Response regulator [Serratia rubidaea]CAI1881128.1 Response regulator [Serratia rubidaea]HAY0638352.1 helix-turn-helix transcriptional regulator [Serratia rubidaea]
MDIFFTEETGGVDKNRQTAFPLYGNDNYYIYSLSLLLEDLLADEDATERQLPAIWVLSGFQDVLSYIQQMKRNAENIVIGDERHYRLLSGIASIGDMFFIHASLPVVEIKERLRFVIRRKADGKMLREYRYHDTQAFSAGARKTIKLLLKGLPTWRVAQECSIHHRAVSVYKRNVMRRLNVNNTQELVIKCRLMELQW